MEGGERESVCQCGLVGLTPEKESIHLVHLLFKSVPFDCCFRQDSSRRSAGSACTYLSTQTGPVQAVWAGHGRERRPRLRLQDGGTPAFCGHNAVRDFLYTSVANEAGQQSYSRTFNTWYWGTRSLQTFSSPRGVGESRGLFEPLT